MKDFYLSVAILVFNVMAILVGASALIDGHFWIGSFIISIHFVSFLLNLHKITR